jgi:hypothetical protein
VAAHTNSPRFGSIAQRPVGHVRYAPKSSPSHPASYPFALPSHTPNTPGRCEARPRCEGKAGFERSLDIDDWRAAKGSLYSDGTYRVLITASREASCHSGSLARMETKGGRDGYPGCPLNGRRRSDSTRERYPLALVYFPPEAIERPRRGFGSSTRGPNIVMLLRQREALSGQDAGEENNF